MTHECLVSSSYGGLKSLSFKIQQYRARYGANVTDHCRQQKALTLRLTCFRCHFLSEISLSGLIILTIRNDCLKQTVQLYSTLLT